MDQFADDYENMRDDWPTTFIYKNASYTGILSDVDVESELQEGGFVQSFDGSLRILMEDFEILPKEGDTLKINSVTYRIAKRSDGPEGRISDLLLINPNK